MMTALTKRVGHVLLSIGIDPRQLHALAYTPRYISDLIAFKRCGGRVDHLFPVLGEYVSEAGALPRHYFDQDLLVARFIHDANPVRHIDVGSRVDGFVAHVAAFRTIEVIDIRPLLVQHNGVRFIRADVMELPSALHGICDSVSCLHALEHFGLGRYGDPINPNGHIVGFNNLAKMLKLGGTLYVSFPIGSSAVHFNAHRVFAPDEIEQWIPNLFTITRFDWIDDARRLHLNGDFHGLPKMEYGCGIYTLKRPGHLTGRSAGNL